MLKKNPLCFSVCRCIDLSICLSVSVCLDWCVDCCVAYWLDCCLAGWLTGWLAGWLACYLSVYLSDWLSVCLPVFVCLFVWLAVWQAGCLFIWELYSLLHYPWFTYWLTHNKILKIVLTMHCRLICMTPLKSHPKIIKTVSCTFSHDGYTLELYIEVCKYFSWTKISLPGRMKWKKKLQ